jgi:hypothetical protein
MWELGHSIALLHICLRYKVKQLIFTGDLFDMKWINIFMSYFVTDDLPFLSHLKSISFRRYGIHPALKHILNQTRITSIEWIFVDSSSSNLVKPHIKNILDAINLNASNLFETNFNMRRLVFKSSDSGESYIHEPNSKSLMHKDLCNLTGDTIDSWLKRNQMNFEKCQKAIATLLGLRKLRKSSCFLFSQRDAMSIVIDMVWDTRGTQVWSQ